MAVDTPNSGRARGSGMVDPDSRISISVGEDGVKTVEEFEDYFQGLEGNYSRSGRIKEAMAFYQGVHRLMNEMDQVVDPDDLGSQSMRHYVESALREYDMKEAAGEVY